ncbi:MAG: DUF6476 family protein, partial [Gemmobacter sp.]
MAHSPDEDPGPPLPASVRLLQWLVIGLTASMMLGVIAVVAVVVTRFPKPATLPLPETLALPPGEGFVGQRSRATMPGLKMLVAGKKAKTLHVSVDGRLFQQ